MKKSIKTEGKLGMHGRLIAQKLSSDNSEAVRIADSKGQSMSTDMNENGEACFEIIGKSRQNEQGAVEICQILVSRLRRDGRNYEEPRKLRGVKKVWMLKYR
jgi:hypothetical protein